MNFCQLDAPFPTLRGKRELLTLKQIEPTFYPEGGEGEESLKNSGTKRKYIL